MLTLVLRRSDFMAIERNCDEEPLKVARGEKAYFMTEVKYDNHKKSKPPVLHDAESGKRMVSTYALPTPKKGNPKWNPREQILDYASFGQTVQAPYRRGMFGVLITHMRIQLVFADRGGCFYSDEKSFASNFALFLAVFIALQSLSGEDAGTEPALTRLAGSANTPLSPADFSTSDTKVFTGGLRTITRPVAPFKVEVQPCSGPSERMAVYAFGHNFVERPVAIKEPVALGLISKALHRKTLATRKSNPRFAKAIGMEISQMQAAATAAQSGQDAYDKGTEDCPRQYAPRVIFGSGISRFQARLVNDSTIHMLQLAWQHKGSVSEAWILRYANELGLRGVPTLVGSYDLADMDDGTIRSRLRKAFHGLKSIRPVNFVLTAEVWKEVCVPLHCITNIANILSALECVLTSASRFLLIQLIPDPMLIIFS